MLGLRTSTNKRGEIVFEGVEEGNGDGKTFIAFAGWMDDRLNYGNRGVYGLIDMTALTTIFPSIYWVCLADVY